MIYVKFATFVHIFKNLFLCNNEEIIWIDRKILTGSMKDMCFTVPIFWALKNHLNKYYKRKTEY